MLTRSGASEVYETNLVVFYCQIVSLLSLFVCDLHEKSTDKRLPDIHIQFILIAEADEFHLKALHRPL